jgi:glycosyltransferase involved in cell wall biosynthesis
VPNPGNPELLLENIDTAVIVPVYSEAEVIKEVISDLLKIFPNVVCVDDGSPDGSGQIALRAGAHVVWHPINFGQGAALQTGIEAALGNPDLKYFVTFDGDGQHSPDDALAMVQKLRAQEFDVVFGSRFLDERTELTAAKRLILKLAVSYTNALSGLKLTDAHNGLRAFNRNVASTINLQQNGMAHATEIVNQISKGKFRYCELPVHIVYTDYSKAKGQSLWNSVNILFDLILR